MHLTESLMAAFEATDDSTYLRMAERIADPVNRLTRATRRIARGDLDARVAATSSDELRRLVEKSADWRKRVPSLH